MRIARGVSFLTSIMTPNATDLRKEQNLRFSLFDGVFTSVTTGFTQDYFTPFLLLLGGNIQQVGALSGLSNFFSSLIQLKSADFTAKLRSRKRTIITFVFLQSLVLLTMAALAFFTHKQPNVFIFLVILFASCGAFGIPAWSSLLSDLVEPNHRGKYFGWRSKVLGLVAIAATLIAGIILQSFRTFDAFRGFVFIFAIAFFFRIASWLCLSKMYEPHLAHNKEDYFNFFDFLARAKESNFVKFVLFVATLSFCVNVASPYFSVFMLKDLGFGYFTYTIMTVSAALTIYLMSGRWGRHADKIGNIKVIKFTSCVISILPLLWVINRNPVFLIFAQIISGFAWAGFNLSASNFIYDAVTPPKRIRCISYFNVLIGLASCLGALTGGFIVEKLPPFLGYKILTLFLISSTSRILVTIFAPGKLKEVRPIEKIDNIQLFFSMVGIRPFFGLERKPVRF